MRNFRTTAIRASFLVIAILAPILLVPGAPDDPAFPPPGNETIIGGPAFKKSDVPPNIQFSLYRLSEIFRTEGPEAARGYATAHGMDLEGESVRVVAVTSSPLPSTQAFVTAALSSQLPAFGGVVETTYRNLVQNRVPISAIEDLAEHPLVSYVRLPLKPQPAVVTSEGVYAVGANQFQGKVGYRMAGEGANVVVLDEGFAGYDSLLGTELPENVTVKSFRADGNLSTSPHGTACAEVIHDVAPNANLTLVNFATDVEHHNAVNWINSQTPKLEILSNSLSWFNAGDGKGTGPICEDVKKFADNGGVWSVAAGNSANHHWQGSFSDPDGDSYMEFDHSGYEMLYVFLPANTSPTFHLNWDDWGAWNGSEYNPGSSQDYDVELFWAPGAAWFFLERSASWQDGLPGQWPVEAVGGWISNVDSYWGIRVKRFSTTRDCRLEVFISGIPASASPTPKITNGSISIPADSPDALAVGAVDWSDQSREPYHGYSSQGPTHNDDIKPDFVSPSRVSTETYGLVAFSGTSAAAPHAAGILALFREITPYSLSQIVTILTNRAIDLGSEGKDNIYGTGFTSMRKK